MWTILKYYGLLDYRSLGSGGNIRFCHIILLNTLLSFGLMSTGEKSYYKCTQTLSLNDLSLLKYTLVNLDLAFNISQNKDVFLGL